MAIIAASLLAIFPGRAIAALPFITDDAGTQGKGTSQVELWYERAVDKEVAAGSTLKTHSNQPGVTFGYGVAENLDLTLGFGRSWGKLEVDGSPSNDAGHAGFSLNAKWQIYGQPGIAFAVKPQIGYSYLVGGSSDDHTVSSGGWLIVTKEYEALAVTMNAGYIYNAYGSAAERDASRSGIWSISALATYEVLTGLKLGLDAGASTNPDKASDDVPVYAEAGAIYSPGRNVDLSLGLIFGITRPAPDFAGTAGITIRF
jgi:hypothetical protein